MNNKIYLSQNDWRREKKNISVTESIKNQLHLLDQISNYNHITGAGLLSSKIAFQIAEVGILRVRLCLSAMAESAIWIGDPNR